MPKQTVLHRRYKALFWLIDTFQESLWLASKIKVFKYQTLREKEIFAELRNMSWKIRGLVDELFKGPMAEDVQAKIKFEVRSSGRKKK